MNSQEKIERPRTPQEEYTQLGAFKILSYQTISIEEVIMPV